MKVNHHDRNDCDLEVLEQGSVLLLADPGQRVADTGVLALNKTLDEKLRMTGAELQELCSKHGLSHPDIAALARRSRTSRSRGREQSSTVDRWVKNLSPIPLETAELLRTKLRLLDKQLTTFKALVETPLDEILKDIYG